MIYWTAFDVNGVQHIRNSGKNMKSAAVMARRYVNRNLDGRGSIHYFTGDGKERFFRIDRKNKETDHEWRREWIKD